MTAIHVEVTAEDIAAAPVVPDVGEGFKSVHPDRKEPVELAIERLTGQLVFLDSDGRLDDPEGHEIATIGRDSTTLVVDLPREVMVWTERYYKGEPVEPFAFDIEVEAWLTDLLRIAGGTADLVTLTEAARVLDLEAQTLRHAANALRDGVASPDALAGRLGIRRVGRDWLVPRHRLEVEVARRAESAV